MLKTALFVAALIASTVAQAKGDECPWTGEEQLSVHAYLRHVEVNDQKYEVGGKHDRRQFEDTLRSCELDDAVRSFRRWRLARRWTNGLAVPSAILIMPIGFVGSATAAGFAGVYSGELSRDMEKGWAALEAQRYAENAEVPAQPAEVVAEGQ